MAWIYNGDLSKPIEDAAQFTNARGITYPGVWDKSTLAGMVLVVETARPDEAVFVITGSEIQLVNSVPTRAWLTLPRPLAAAKAARITAANSLLDTKVAAGRLHNTKTYQIDAKARENFLGVAGMFGMAALNPHGGTWRDLANAEIPLNDVEMRALLASVFAYSRDLRRALTTHIVAIRALATVAAVNAYDINPGWPANS